MQIDHTHPEGSPPTQVAGGPSTGEILSFEKDLLKLARLQLQSDMSLAEDVVQETLLAAVQGASKFRGESSLKTWLVGILKFKVLDALRGRARQPIPVADLEPELHTEDLEEVFDETGVWRMKPHEWSDPAFAAHQFDFMRWVEICLTHLPTHTARVFMLREMFELNTEDICQLLEITPNHVGVLLYRARMTLRRCLEIHWLHR
jgi:RNA polymerase sigma-70 factor (ECF subfamily)